VGAWRKPAGGSGLPSGPHDSDGNDPEGIFLPDQRYAFTQMCERL
jgi:hypothetical protein